MQTNLLIITRNFFPTIGGVETYIAEFIKYFIKRKMGCLYIICPKKSSLPDYLKNEEIYLYTPQWNLAFVEIDIILRGILVWLQGFVYQINILINGAKLLLKKNKDIIGIYGVGGVFSILPTIFLSRLFGIKAYGHMHFDFQFSRRNKILKIFYRCIFNNLDRIFVNSKDVEIDLACSGINKSKIIIITNWVDTRIFRLKDKYFCRRLLNLPFNKKILLFVGRLSYEKGINEILYCADYFRNEKNFFVIIGEGPLKKVIEKRIQCRNNVIYLGPKRSFDLVDYYNAADVLLWGSIDTHYFSITIMEALHCGLPILAPRGTTNLFKWGKKEYEVKEDILPDFLGLLFENSAKGLSEAIEKSSHLNFDRNKISQYAIEHFSDKNASKILDEFYTN